jgi:hypothetical protein
MALKLFFRYTGGDGAHSFSPSLSLVIDYDASSIPLGKIKSFF